MQFRHGSIPLNLSRSIIGTTRIPRTLIYLHTHASSVGADTTYRVVACLIKAAINASVLFGTSGFLFFTLGIAIATIFRVEIASGFLQFSGTIVWIFENQTLSTF